MSMPLPGQLQMLRYMVDMSLPVEWRDGYWERGLSARERNIAASTYFLLGGFGKPESEQVGHFVTHTLGRLVGQLSRRTERRQVTYQGQVRGRILWPATFKARYTENHDPTRFVCQEVARRYDTPENQLLKYMIQRLKECLAAVPESIRGGYCLMREAHEPAGEAAETIDPADLPLARIESALRIFGGHPSLREVALPDYVDERHLLSAESASLTEYAEVALFYRRYQQTVLFGAWDQLLTIGRRMIPLPDLTSGDGLWLQLAAAVLHDKGDSRRPAADASPMTAALAFGALR